MACSCQILNKKVALALLILSIYGILLVFVSSDRMSPKFIIASIKHSYHSLSWTKLPVNSSTNTSSSLSDTDLDLAHFLSSAVHLKNPTAGKNSNGSVVMLNKTDKWINMSNNVRNLTVNTSSLHTIAKQPANKSLPLVNATTNYIIKILQNSTQNSTNITQPLLVLFTTFRNSSEKTHIYENTMKMWHLLYPAIQPVLYTIPGELDMSVLAKKYGWDVYKVPKMSQHGVPILRHMFLHAQEKYNSTYYGYANGDILFDQGLVKTLQVIKPSLKNMKQVLIVGRRTNYPLKSKQLINSLAEVTAFGKKGQLFSTNAQDYFISKRNGYPWSSIPNFVVGRVGYDNWLVVTALVKRMYTIDTTLTLLALHQTGTDGNYAGHSKKPKGDTYINYGLAGSKFDYALGHVSCGQIYTKLENGKPKMFQRERNGCEGTFRKYHVNPYLSLKRNKRYAHL